MEFSPNTPLTLFKILPFLKKKKKKKEEQEDCNGEEEGNNKVLPKIFYVAA